MLPTYVYDAELVLHLFSLLSHFDSCFFIGSVVCFQLPKLESDSINLTNT